jgi:hypothetical protein
MAGGAESGILVACYRSGILVACYESTAADARFY